jgi:hypothetical protein
LARSRAIIVACVALLSGCASIFDGTTQQITVNTTPSGARCTFWKNGGLVGDVASTPGSTVIRKSKDDLFIVCDKPGYASATFVNRSGLAMATFANILTGGLAWALDSSRGADNKYQSDVTLAMVPASPSAPLEQAPPVPPAPDPTVPVRAAAPVPPRAPAPAPAPAAPVAPAPPVAGPQIDCASSDGSRIRVTGSACPAGWTVAR